MSTSVMIHLDGSRKKDRYKQTGSNHTVLILIWMTILLSMVQGSQRLVEKWTVGIPGGLEEANRVAEQHGCKNLGLVRGFNDVYLFEKQVDPEGVSDSDRVHRTKRELESHACVAWVDPQTPQKRVKRDLITQHLLISAGRHGSMKGSAQVSGQKSTLDRSGARAFAAIAAPSPISSSNPFNDELWTHQWYLQDNSNAAHIQNDIELKVEEVWKMGFSGKGIVVTILDDGLEWNHTDILPNYDARASWDMNNNRSDPFPRYDGYDSNSHGTRCAGEVAMVANNKKCGVGVAPRARIGGIKCLDGEVADHIESMSLLHNIDYIDIYSGSWGPSDNGQVVDGPKRLATQAFERGIKFGRQGKGALYVWANGNGGALGDNCNCDGYVNSIYTISIGGVTQQGQIPFYGERCSSTLAVTCSSGAYTDRKIVTTDLHNKCTIDYTGTSAAAPLAAGIYALVLEANRNLTWRDAQHLTVWTSNPVPIRDNPGWKRNGAGLIFNSRFGFGLLNAKAMVDAALSWQTVPKKSVCSLAPSTRLPVFIQSRNLAQVVFVSDGCQREYENHQKQMGHHNPMATLVVGNPSMMMAPPNMPRGQPTPVIYLEHVQVIIDVEYTSRGNLDIFLISPAGTVSTLLSRRPLDVSRHGFDKWPLMSVHFWGETSIGKWTLIVRDKDGQNNRGLLRNATLVLHGTSIRPAHQAKPRVYDGEGQIPSFIDPVLELDEDDIYDLNTFPNDMALVKDDSFQPTFIKSVIAMEQEHQRDYKQVECLNLDEIPPKFNDRFLPIGQRNGQYIEDLGRIIKLDTILPPKPVDKYMTKLTIFNRRMNEPKELVFRPKQYCVQGSCRGPFQYDLLELANSGFDRNLKTIVMIPGFWTGDEVDWMNEARDLWLKLEDVNIILVTWSHSNGFWYSTAVADSPLVARQITIFLYYLAELHGLHFLDDSFVGNLHFVGHSLGAHISGFVGQDFEGRLGRITGLDPAGPSFDQMPRSLRLDTTDAKLVDIIHTNAGKMKYTKAAASLVYRSSTYLLKKIPLVGSRIANYIESKNKVDKDTAWYGIDAKLGHIDYYANDGKVQPGCVDPIIKHSCDHGRSYEILVDILHHELMLKQMPVDRDSSRLLAIGSDNYENYISGRSFARNCPTLLDAGRRDSPHDLKMCTLPLDLLSPVDKLRSELSSVYSLNFNSQSDSRDGFYFSTRSDRPFVNDQFLLKVGLSRTDWKESCALRIELYMHGDSTTIEFNEQLPEVRNDYFSGIAVPFITSRDTRANSIINQLTNKNYQGQVQDLIQLLPTDIKFTISSTDPKGLLASARKKLTKFVSFGYWGKTSNKCQIHVDSLEVIPIMKTQQQVIASYGSHIFNGNEMDSVSVTKLSNRDYIASQSQEFYLESSEDECGVTRSLNALMIG